MKFCIKKKAIRNVNKDMEEKICFKKKRVNMLKIILVRFFQLLLLYFLFIIIILIMNQYFC